uniref:Uncharacterized protein n=1 Tax=Arundo donax TaxID=35708 RepID=A0A0A8XZY9_ARUDO
MRGLSRHQRQHATGRQHTQHLHFHCRHTTRRPAAPQPSVPRRVLPYPLPRSLAVATAAARPSDQATAAIPSRHRGTSTARDLQTGAPGGRRHRRASSSSEQPGMVAITLRLPPPPENGTEAGAPSHAAPGVGPCSTAATPARPASSSEGHGGSPTRSAS